jgi:DNA-binding XRE family transcriptional regulator
MSHALEIHHDLGDITLKPSMKVNQARLKKMLRSTLDQYLEEERVPAQALHHEAKQRHGAHYRTPGYYLRLYRQRADLTQAALAEQAGIHQHHLSEMENNKRVLGKAIAKKLASLLQCDYRKLL